MEGCPLDLWIFVADFAYQKIFSMVPIKRERGSAVPTKRVQSGGADKEMAAGCAHGLRAAEHSM